MAKETSVTIEGKLEFDTSETKKINDDVEKATKKSKITIDEWAKQNNMTFEQAKQKIDAIAEGYIAEGKRVQDAYKRAYKDLGVLSEEREKKLKKEQESLKDVGKSAEDTANSMGDLSSKTEKATSSTNNLEKSTENTADSMGDLSSEANKAVSSTESLGKKANSAAKQTEKQGESTKEAAKNTKSYGNENKDAAKKTGTLSDAAEKAKKTAKNFGSAIKKAGELAKKANKALTSTLKVFQGLANFSASAFRATATGVATGMTTVATAATGLIGMGTAYNAEIEQYRMSFEVMTGSAEKADEIIGRLKKIGAETPFELSDVTEATQLLMNYGFTADDAVESMMMLGDISQGDKDKLTSIARALGQMSSKGKVLREEINQMIEAGFSPLLAISEATGESMESLDLRLEEGSITVDEIRAAIVSATSEGGKYYQSMIKQSKTFSGQLSTLKDNFKSFTGVMAEAATGSKANDFFPLLNESLTSLEEALTSGGFKQLANTFGKELSKFTAMGLIHLPNLMDLGTDIMQSIVDGFIDGEYRFNEAIKTVFKKIPTFIKNNMDLGFKFGSELIKLITKGVNDNTTGISNAVSHMIASFVGFFEENAPLVKEAATNLINALAEGITKDSDKITSSIFHVLTLIPQFIAENIGTISSIIVSFVQNISNGINENKDLLKESASTIVNALAYGLADLVEIGLGIITDLIGVIEDAIEKNETALKEAVSRVIGALVKFITNNIKPFANAAITIIRAFVGGLSDPENIRLVSAAVIDIISLFGKVVSENLSDFLGAALTIITEIASGLKSAEASSKIGEAIEIVLNSIVDAVEDNIDLLVNAATSIIGFLMDDLLTMENIEKITEGAAKLIDKINNELLTDENLDKIYRVSGELVGKAIEAFAEDIENGRFIIFANNVYDSLVNAFKSIHWYDLWETILSSFLSGLTGIDAEIFENMFKVLSGTTEKENFFKNQAIQATRGMTQTLGLKGPDYGTSSSDGHYRTDSLVDIIKKFRDANNELQSGIANNVTNNNNVDNSSTATYNTTNYNTFEIRNDQDIKWLGEMLESDAVSNRKGRGY